MFLIWNIQGSSFIAIVSKHSHFVWSPKNIRESEFIRENNNIRESENMRKNNKEHQNFRLCLEVMKNLREN